MILLIFHDKNFLEAVMRITVASSFPIGVKSRNIYIFLDKWLKLKRKEILYSNSYTIWETTNLKFRKLNLDPHRGHLRSLKVKKVKF